jgi:hypothetical protein
LANYPKSVSWIVCVGPIGLAFNLKMRVQAC